MPGRRQKYVLDPQQLRAARQANEQFELAPGTQDLANLFDTLTREEQGRFVETFSTLVPVFGDIKARANNGKKRLMFQDRWETSLWYEAQQVSDGTMLAAAFVALTHQRDTPNLIVIEDPDRGLHPYLQRQIIDMLRKLSSGALSDEPIQVVCTTHSKALLDFLEPDEVRFISRRRDTGETVIQRAPTDNENWRQLYATFDNSLGNLWMTGALGGVPGE